MRWNPKAPGEHQYASDIAWDGNIARFMQHYYDKYGIKRIMFIKITIYNGPIFYE